MGDGSVGFEKNRRLEMKEISADSATRGEDALCTTSRRLIPSSAGSPSPYGALLAPPSEKTPFEQKSCSGSILTRFALVDCWKGY